MVGYIYILGLVFRFFWVKKFKLVRRNRKRYRLRGGRGRSRSRS